VYLLTGYYMYIETSAPRRPGQKARVLSPTFPPTTGRCMTFFYHMYGQVGTLNIRLFSQGTLRPAIWTRSGNQYNMWRIGQVTLNSDSPYQVSIRSGNQYNMWRIGQ
jgi:hypothetical protein